MTLINITPDGKAWAQCRAAVYQAVYYGIPFCDYNAYAIRCKYMARQFGE